MISDKDFDMYAKKAHRSRVLIEELKRLRKEYTIVTEHKAGLIPTLVYSRGTEVSLSPQAYDRIREIVQGDLINRCKELSSECNDLLK